MTKASLVVSGPYGNGQIFNRANELLNRDDCLAFFFYLKEAFKNAGVDLNTSDVNDPAKAEYVIYNDMPKTLPNIKDVSKSYLLLFESGLVRPDNWHLDSHRLFSKIFTWNDDFVDNQKYFKMNFTHSGMKDFLSFEAKSKFCTLIAGNKSFHHELELYSARKQAIRWFEKFHPSEFDFYGVGWDRHTFTGPKLVRALNRVGVLRKLLAEKWPSYKGCVQGKLETLQQYKFSICYENARDIPGYITEKIFDSMAAGCIPVYWGAPNVTDFIPESCFIDKRKFQSYESLYGFLQGMTAEEYNQRLRAIRAYLSSTQHEPFSPGPSALSVVNAIIGQQIGKNTSPGKNETR